MTKSTFIIICVELAVLCVVGGLLFYTRQYIEPYIVLDRFIYSISSISMLLSAMITAGLVYYLYVPDRWVAAYACVRVSKFCVYASFSPLALFGLDRLKLNGFVQLDVAFDHSLFGSCFFLLVSMISLQISKKDYVKLDRERNPVKQSAATQR